MYLCIGAEYGAVTALGINTSSTRLLCGHAKGQVVLSNRVQNYKIFHHFNDTRTSI